MATFVGIGLSVGSVAIPAEGPELILNGTPSSDTVWTAGAGWAFSTDRYVKTAGTATFLSQPVTFQAGAVYYVRFTLVQTAGGVTPQFVGGTSANGTFRNASGTYEEQMTANSGNVQFRFNESATFAGSVRLISVKKKNR
jgi:hypothetical protein